MRSMDGMDYVVAQLLVDSLLLLWETIMESYKDAHRLDIDRT